MDSSTHPAYVIGYVFAQGLVDMALTGAMYFMPFLLMAAVVAIWKFFMRRNYDLPEGTMEYIRPSEPFDPDWAYYLDNESSLSRDPVATRHYLNSLSPDERAEVLRRLRRNAP